MLVVSFGSAPVVDHLHRDFPRLLERDQLLALLVVDPDILEVVVHQGLPTEEVAAVADDGHDLLPQLSPLPEKRLLRTAQTVVLVLELRVLLLELGHLLPELFLQVVVVVLQLPVLLLELVHLLPELADGGGDDHHPEGDADADEDGDDEEHAVHC